MSVCGKCFALFPWLHIGCVIEDTLPFHAQTPNGFSTHSPQGLVHRGWVLRGEGLNRWGGRGLPGNGSSYTGLDTERVKEGNLVLGGMGR